MNRDQKTFANILFANTFQAITDAQNYLCVTQSVYSLPQKKVYTFVEPSTQNWGGLDEK